ncbi:hypothetical protein CF328_g7056 [Tilletia controversa]|nr:hypothetical protein CF328_g7056 [Tilletia controversa]
MLSQLPDRPGPPVALAAGAGAGAVAMVMAKVPPAQRSNKQSSLPLVASLAHLPLSRPQALHHASAHAMKPPIPDTIAPCESHLGLLFARFHPDPTPTLIGADWNSVPDPYLDSLNGDPTSIPWRAPAAAIAPTYAVDVFRVLRPDSFSWTFASPTSARRLDSIWASPELLPHVASTDVASCRSDHRAVRVTFLQAPSPGAPAAPFSDGRLPPHRPWSLHPGMWNDPIFTRELSAFASFYNPPHLATPSAIDDWALYHGALFTFLQPLARSVSATQQRARSNLDHAKRDLDGLDLRDPTDATRLPSLLRQWRSSCSAVASSASLRPGGSSSASALREGSWLFSSYASAASRAIPPLTTDLGLAVSSADKLQALTSFYADLFSDRPVSTASPSPLIYAIQLRLDDTAARTANAPFTLQEVHRALRTANRHSSSGPDGIPYRVYLATFESFGPLLQALANALGDGPQWPVTARTILLPKSGDPANISNYRPITITNAYVRVISRLLSGRFLSLGEKLLPWTQSAFLPGRRSSLIAGTLHAIHDLQQLPPNPLTPPPMFVISIDQKKAYDDDRVHRDWLFALNIGVPIPILGTLSGLAFADDSLFFLEASHHGLSQLPLFLACLDAYAAESGAAINTHKSAFWLVGTPKAEDEAATRKLAEGLAAYGLSSSTTSGPLSHLGHPLPSDASEPHPKPLLARLAAIARRAACFRTQGVDIYTRVLTSNRLLGSRLWHSIAVGPLPVDLSRKYFDSVLPYLRGSQSSISHTTLTRPLEHGGFGLIDPDAMADSHFTWLAATTSHQQFYSSVPAQPSAAFLPVLFGLPLLRS